MFSKKYKFFLHILAKKNYDMRTSAAQLAKAQDMLEKKEEKWILINQRIQDIDIKLARVLINFSLTVLATHFPDCYEWKILDWQKQIF